jgi:hypothetical protein
LVFNSFSTLGLKLSRVLPWPVSTLSRLWQLPAQKQKTNDNDKPKRALSVSADSNEGSEEGIPRINISPSPHPALTDSPLTPLISEAIDECSSAIVDVSASPGPGRRNPSQSREVGAKPNLEPLDHHSRKKYDVAASESEANTTTSPPVSPQSQMSSAASPAGSHSSPRNLVNAAATAVSGSTDIPAMESIAKVPQSPDRVETPWDNDETTF